METLLGRLGQSAKDPKQLGGLYENTARVNGSIGKISRQSGGSFCGNTAGANGTMGKKSK